jgi:hypothetical protein
MDPAITAILSISGVVVGASLQWWFARRTNEHKQLLETRAKAYSDVFEATCRLATARRLGETINEIELLSKLTDAKARVCIYGEETVVRDLAKFWQSGATFETESGILAFTRFCMNVRKSYGIKDASPLNSEVADLLFGVRPK